MCKLLNTYSRAIIKFLRRPAFVQVAMKINPPKQTCEGAWPSLRSHLRLAPSEQNLRLRRGALGIGSRRALSVPHVLKVETPYAKQQKDPGSQRSPTPAEVMECQLGAPSYGSSPTKGTEVLVGGSGFMSLMLEFWIVLG